MSILGEIAQGALLDEVLARIDKKIAQHNGNRRTVAVLKELKQEVIYIHPLMLADGTRITF